MQEIEGFVIGEKLHSGAMGNIFRVTKPGLIAPMIMKVPRVGPNEPSEGIISFETEATIVPSLTGPHVPRFVAAGDLARTPFLVTEWIDGTSLEEVLRGGPLPPVEVVRVGAAIADALHSLHRQDVIHLDVKPANIILKKDGTVALVDFGFAHHARFPDLLAEETRFGAGSAPYISPEQVLGTREDTRSDVFSLGVVMYEMATGQFPFGEPDTDVRNRLWLDPTPPSKHERAIEPWLQEIILRCLEPKAADRYQSAALVAFDLRNPEQLTLTSRATKTHRARLFEQIRRFLKARGEYGARPKLPHIQVSRSPIIMVAVDTSNLDDERLPAIRSATAQVMSLNKEFRLIAVSVFPPPPPSEASRVHVDHLIRLRHWIDPIAITRQRLSLHAIESDNPGDALVDFARINHVDLIIVGAPGPTQPDRSWSQSVASTVTANAPCSVHVVRVPEGTI
jgi:eukaryotic-like serine/threonine-protein kinase